MEFSFMTQAQEPQVRALFARCHPGVAAHPSWWYFAYPTIAAYEPVTGRVRGFCGFSIGFLPSGEAIEIGNDLCVDPEARGQGIGRRLHDMRVNVGRNVGAVLYSGLTAPDNRPMIRIFEACGYELVSSGPEGLTYVGRI